MDREEIIQKIKDDTGVDVTEVTTICQNHIDRIQDKIASGLYYDAGIPKTHAFSFLTKYDEINTSASYTTGTVDVTNGSATVSGTDTVFASSHVGWFFRVGTEYYRVKAVVSNTEITLENEYIGDTDTGVSYSLTKVFYDLPSDFKEMVWVKELVTDNRVIPLEELEMADYFTDEFSYSGNLKGYVLGEKIRFYPQPTTAKRAYLCYTKELPSINSTGAESVLPSKFHMLFVFGLEERVWNRLDRPEKVVASRDFYNELMYQLVSEDRKKSRDRIDVFADEAIVYTRRPQIRFPSNYPDL